MLDIGSSELLVIIIVAVLVIGPKDLPRALHTIGRYVGKARAMTRHLRSGIDEMVRQAELEELEKKWAAENARIMAQHPPAQPDEANPDATGAGDTASPPVAAATSATTPPAGGREPA